MRPSPLFTLADLPTTLYSPDGATVCTVARRALYPTDRCVMVCRTATDETFYVDIYRARAIARRLTVAQCLT